jgi:hypothetical protein
MPCEVIEDVHKFGIAAVARRHARIPHQPIPPDTRYRR